MSKELKMKDVFCNLPWREDGNVSFLYVSHTENVMIAKAVNNYDGLTHENKDLRNGLKTANSTNRKLSTELEQLRKELEEAKEIINEQYFTLQVCHSTFDSLVHRRKGTAQTARYLINKIESLPKLNQD